MAELIGLALFLLGLFVVLLPVVTLLRMSRLSGDVRELAQRVRRLEARAAGPATASAPGAPVAPAAPGAATAEAAPVAPGIPTIPASSVAPTAAAVPVAPATPGAHTAPAAPAVARTRDFESLVGGRGLLYVGIVILLLGVSFFLKYAFDNAWVNETARVLLGGVAGLGLIIGGVRLAARGLAAFGQALAGAGFVILYLATYGALAFYSLIGRGTAFALMAIVTVGAAALADRLRAQSLALIALAGGFLTPFLVGGTENQQLTLFTYTALLVAGALGLALRHAWIALNAVSYVLTLITLLAWADRYYSSDQWLRTLLFLTLFVVWFLNILRATARSASWSSRLVVGLLATAPAFYHVAAIVITADHPPAVHVYIIMFTAAGLWLTAEPHRPWVRLIILLGGFAPLFGTLTLPDGLSWVWPNSVTIFAVAALHGIALLDRVLRQAEALEQSDLLALHLTGLGLFALLAETLRPAYPDSAGTIAALLALGAFGLWQALLSRERVAALNLAALAFTLAAIAVAMEFDGAGVIVGWGAEGAAAVWIGLRAHLFAFRAGGLALWGLAVLRLWDGYFQTPTSFTILVNQRAFTSIFLIALAYWMVRLFKRSPLPGAQDARLGLHIAASALTLMGITAEIRAYWDVRPPSTQGTLSEQVLLSLSWGLYGAMLVVAGLRRSYPPVRYLGMAALGVTVAKVFVYDLWQLGGIYRVVGFLGFGVLLVLVSYLYQRRRSPATEAAPAPIESS